MTQLVEKNWHLVEEMTERLKALNPYKVILFGSYAVGNPTEDSDLDVAVILDSDEIVKTFREDMDRWHPVAEAVREVNYKIAMDILVYSKAEIKYLKEEGNDFIEEIESSGKVLYEK
ncbi:MAG: nucleotidyltransferase domain-containing protein [Chitinispirillales bacterium]|jgi:predicted nucleotidyltransferase|nr:nucleotidyltransferase domain-containing protein [Chitinispirillales bacterium]